MNDEQTLIINYLKSHEGETVEDVLTALSANPDHYSTLAENIAYLIWNDKGKQIDQNPRNGALTLRESARRL